MLKFQKVLLIIACIFFSLSLVTLACGVIYDQFFKSETVSAVERVSDIEQLSGKVYVFTDPDTNLQYLVYTVNGGICPRYGVDGKQLNGGQSWKN